MAKFQDLHSSIYFIGKGENSLNIHRKNRLLVFIRILIFFTVTITIYFCIDVFGIVSIPRKYSIASLFYSQVEIIAKGQIMEQTDITKNTNIIKKEKPIAILDSRNKNKIEEDVDLEENITNEEVPARDLLKELQEAESRRESKEEHIEYDENDPKHFYYNQLNDYAKKIYDKLEMNMIGMRTGTYNAEFDLEFNDLLHEEDGSATLDSAFQYAINALTFDNPDLFYIDVTKIYLSTEIRTIAFSKTYRVTVGMNLETNEKYLADGMNDENDVNRAIEEVETIKNNIIEKCKDMDTVDQLKCINDYLIDNVRYDSGNGRNVYNIYGTLIDGKAVCEGYARSVKYILDELNIPCIIACGIGQNSTGTTESHAWNYVYINDNWYALDVTWDDPIIVGEGVYISDNIRYNYFLKGSDVFFKNHFEDGNIVDNSNFKYPEISKTNLEF